MRKCSDFSFQKTTSWRSVDCRKIIIFRSEVKREKMQCFFVPKDYRNSRPLTVVDCHSRQMGLSKIGAMYVGDPPLVVARRVSPCPPRGGTWQNQCFRTGSRIWWLIGCLRLFEGFLYKKGDKRCAMHLCSRFKGVVFMLPR